MDEALPIMPRVLAIIVLPLALAVMVPLALVFVILFYVNAQLRALWTLIELMVLPKATHNELPRKPHFLEAPSAENVKESSSLR